MKKLTRRKLARFVAEQSGMPKSKAYQAVALVLEGISVALAEGGRVELRNFGTFEVIERKAREIEVPGQGTIEVGKRPDVSFQPGKRLREWLSKEDEE